MYIGKSSGGKVSSSAFRSTYEPGELSVGATRILLESHTTRSKKSSVIDGRAKLSLRNELSLATLALKDSETAEWRSAPAFLVELTSDSSDSSGSVSGSGGTGQTMRIAGVTYGARDEGERHDAFGAWDWSITAAAVPLDLLDGSVLGDVRVSGRGLAAPAELQAVSLEQYWTGRRELLAQELG